MNNNGSDKDNDYISAFGRSQSHVANIFHTINESSSPLKKGDSTFSNRTKDFRLNLKGKLWANVLFTLKTKSSKSPTIPLILYCYLAFNLTI